MNDKRKRNIIIGALCGVLLIMAVGYAAFATQLNIEGTTSITSSWNVKITNIESKNATTGASDAVEPSYEDLTATFKANLTSPGDYIEYEITIENQGSLDAELARIKMSKSTNPAIKFSHSGIEEGSILAASGGSAKLIVKVEYSDEVTSQPEDTSAEVKVTLDYVQKGHKSEWVPDDAITSADLIGKVTTEGDGLYADPNSEESGRYVYAGADPDNYITFNNEEAGWRIISIETNGELKIMKDPKAPVTTKEFDSKGARTTGYCSQGTAPIWGCNVYAKTDTYTSANGSYTGAVEKDSEMKTYLENEYYQTITTNTESISKGHTWYYGSVYDGKSGAESDYRNLSLMVTNEKKYSFTSNIGLISPSDYIKSNTNTAQCGTAKLHYDNSNTCKTTNWMTPPSGYYWTLSPRGSHTGSVLHVNSNGALDDNSAHNTYGVVPSLYLISNIHLSGKGTKQEPYKIETTG